MVMVQVRDDSLHHGHNQGHHIIGHGHHHGHHSPHIHGHHSPHIQVHHSPHIHGHHSPHINGHNSPHIHGSHGYHSPQVQHGHHSPHIRGHHVRYPENSPIHTLKSLYGKYRHLRSSGHRKNSSTPKVKRLSEPRRNYLSGNFQSPVLRLAVEDNDSVFKEDFKLGKLLGSGGFGSVYLANGKSGNGSLAIKVMNKPTMSKNPVAMYESFKAELQCLKLSHPNIVQSIGATPMTSFEDGAWVVMEYAGSRTLQAVLNDPQITMTIELRLRYSSQLAHGLQYLHNNNIVHLDIKPANVLISPDGDCKIGDLGCSQILEDGTGRISPTQRSSLTGTFAYRAPELLRGSAPTRKADIYSVGITMWQMMARDNPYGNENQHVVIFGVVAYGHRPKVPHIDENNCFELCYRDLYSQCWDTVPDNRPSADELVQVLDVWKDNI